MQTWHGHGLRLAFQFSAWAGPEKRPWQNRQSCQPIEQVLGHPLFFLRLPSNAFPDIGKANAHGKTQAILFLLWSIWFFREVFGFALRYFCFCREVFGFAVRYFVFAVMFLFLPWQLWATIALCLPLLDRPKKREKTILQGALQGLAWRLDRWRH